MASTRQNDWSRLRAALVESLTNHRYIDDPRREVRFAHREATDPEAQQIVVQVWEQLERLGWAGPTEDPQLVAERRAIFKVTTPTPAGPQAEGAGETVRVGDLEADHATVNGVVLRDQTAGDLGLTGRGGESS